MKEIKAYLNNQKDLYMVMYLDSLKNDNVNLLEAREALNMVCALDILLQQTVKTK